MGINSDLFGPALSYRSLYEASFENSSRTWGEFRDAMLLTFGPVTNPIDDWRALGAIRQSGSVDDYAKKFSAILSRNPSFRTATIHLTFIDGLASHLKAHVLRVGANTLEDVILEARVRKVSCAPPESINPTTTVSQQAAAPITPATFK